MTEAEVLTLNWEGPVRPAAMDLSADAMDRMTRPGVYLCLKRYDAVNRVRAYAGVTKDFRLRLREHVAATLGLAYDIADADGQVVFRHTHRDSLFEAAHRAEELHPLAVAEVHRMTWFFALDDTDPYIPWNIVEGLLIHRLKTVSMCGATTASGDIIDTVNEKGGSLPTGPVVLRNTGAEEAIGLLGDEIAWPLENAA